MHRITAGCSVVQWLHPQVSELGKGVLSCCEYPLQEPHELELSASSISCKFPGPQFSVGIQPRHLVTTSVIRLGKFEREIRKES